MAYPPGQGKSGMYFMELWRGYLEEFAEREGDIEGQIIVGAYSSVEILTTLAQTLDRAGRFRDLIDQRITQFREADKQAGIFEDRLLRNG